MLSHVKYPWMHCSNNELFLSILRPFDALLQASGIPVRVRRSISMRMWSYFSFFIVFQSEAYILIEPIATYASNFTVDSLSSEDSGMEKINFLILTIAGFAIDISTHLMLITTLAKTLKKYSEQLQAIHDKVGQPRLRNTRRVTYASFAYVIYTVAPLPYNNVIV